MISTGTAILLSVSLIGIMLLIVVQLLITRITALAKICTAILLIQEPKSKVDTDIKIAAMQQIKRQLENKTFL